MICDNFFFFLEIVFDATPSKPPNWTSILSQQLTRKYNMTLIKRNSLSLSLFFVDVGGKVVMLHCFSVSDAMRFKILESSSIVHRAIHKTSLSSKPWISSPFKLSHICTTNLFFYLFIHQWWGWESRQRKGGIGRRILIWGSYKLESSGGGL